MWETKDRFKVGYASVVRTHESAGQETLMDFVGMIVHTKYILYFVGTYLVYAWYILHTRTDLHESEHVNMTFVFAENVLVLNGKTEIFPQKFLRKLNLSHTMC